MVRIWNSANINHSRCGTYANCGILKWTAVVVGMLGGKTGLKRRSRRKMRLDPLNRLLSINPEWRVEMLTKMDVTGNREVGNGKFHPLQRLPQLNLRLAFQRSVNPNAQRSPSQHPVSVDVKTYPWVMWSTLTIINNSSIFAFKYASSCFVHILIHMTQNALPITDFNHRPINWNTCTIVRQPTKMVLLLNYCLSCEWIEFSRPSADWHTITPRKKWFWRASLANLTS